jgi:putative nucleotidyltransferase with HDIG domain
MGDCNKYLSVEQAYSVNSATHTNAYILKSLLTALKTHDAYTYRHSVRTVRLSLLLARACKLKSDSFRALCLGALLHDVGKIYVPTIVLHKHGPLTSEEWETIKQHPQAGASLALGVRVATDVVRTIAEHHERWDGGGYPVGLSGTQIALPARVVAVADAFDAMTSTRAYRSSRSYMAATDELERCAGTQFDPQVVSAFSHTIATRQLPLH